MHVIYNNILKCLINTRTNKQVLRLSSAFKDYLKGALDQNITKDIITRTANDILKPILAKESMTKISENVVSNASSLGIGIPLAFLGEFLATKKIDSPTARFVAGLLGAKVDHIKRDIILDKLKDKRYYIDVREKVLKVTNTSSVEEFSKLLGENYSIGEAWNIYRQIKDMILDTEIFDISTVVTDISINISDLKDTINSRINMLRVSFDNMLGEVEDRLEKNFRQAQTELHLLETDFQLVSSFKGYGLGNTNCWKDGYFTDADIKNGYDARRPVTDVIIKSINDNFGTILYGKRYHGKSLILKRVMFEEIEQDYTVVYSHDIVKANANLIAELFNRILQDYPRLLVIVDNVHKSGSEDLFHVFNEFFDKQHPDYRIRFLFSARKEELDISKENVEWSIKKDIDHALERIKPIAINFEKDDANLFLKQALSVTSFNQRQISERSVKEKAERMYDYSNGDPFMFVFALMYHLVQDKSETYLDFIENDIIQKIKSLGKENDLWKAVLLCSFLGIHDIPIKVENSSLSSSSEMLKCCDIYEDYLGSLQEESILFKEKKDIYRIRHGQWALEFLHYIYSDKFDGTVNGLFKGLGYSIKEAIHIKQLVRDANKQIIICILNNIEMHDHLTILVSCTSLYVTYDRYRSICKLFIENYDYFDPKNTLSNEDAAYLYCFGLGTFYTYIKDYPNSLKYNDKAITFQPQFGYAWLNKGMSLFKMKKYEEAIACYDKAIQIDPTMALVWNNKGLALYNKQKYEESINCYDKAIQIDPTMALVWNNKGLALYNKQKYEESINCYDKAIQIDPTIAPVWNNKGLALCTMQKYEEGIKCCDRAIELDPDDIRGEFVKGLCCLSMRNYAVAVQNFDRATKLEVKDDIDKSNFHLVSTDVNKGEFLSLSTDVNKVEHIILVEDINPDIVVLAFYYKGISLDSLGEFEEGIKCFDESLEINSTFSPAISAKGVALFNLGNVDEANRYYDKALEINPYNYEAWYGKSSIFISKGNFEEALKLLDKSIEIDPRNFQSWYNKGEIYLILGLPTEATKYYDEVINLNPMFSFAWSGKATAVLQQGNFEEALKLLDKSIEIDPRNYHSLLIRGLYHYIRKNRVEAIRYLDEVLEINPMEFQALSLKGVSLGDLGNPQEAIKYVDKALEINNKFPNLWTNKGYVLLLQGKHEEACKVFDEAIRMFPSFPPVFYYKGIIFYQLRQYLEAIACYDKALELNPFFAEPWNNKGLVLYGLDKYEEAIACYDKALELNPFFAEPLVNKGLVLYDLEKFDAVLEQYKKALTLYEKLDDRSTLAAIYLASADLLTNNLNRHEEALVEYDKVISLDPQNFDAYFNKGIALVNLQRYDQALEYFGQALKVFKHLNDKAGLGNIYAAIGDVNFSLEKYDDALNCYNKSLHYYKDVDDKESVAVLHNAIANLLIDKKEYKDALNNYLAALEIHLELYDVSNASNINNSKIVVNNYDDNYDKTIYDSQNPDSMLVIASDYVNMGLTLGYLKDHHKAIEYYDKALKISPHNVTALENKGYILSDLEQYKEAIDLETMAIEVDPKYSTAWYNRACYYACINRIDEALSNLKEAISLDEKYGHNALDDKDFDNIRDNQRFKDLLNRFK